MTDALHALFHPATVAIVGASTNPRKYGGLPVSLSLTRGFAGRLYPVNASADEVQGLPAYRSVGDIEGPVDCAVISVPAPAVIPAIEACAEKGVRIASVFSSGFAEIDEEGRRNQERIAAIGRAAGMRVIGPNSMGAFCLNSNFIATFTTAFNHFGENKGWPATGRISIASQSGAVGVQFLVLLRERGLGISKWVTTGNQCDVDIADCLAYLADDPETDTITVYLEGCADGQRLAAALAAARANRKPVIMLKVGSSDVGAAAAASHTASLAGADEVFDAVFRQFGVHRARTAPELADVAAAVDHGRYPASRDIGVVTTSGGIGALMADEAVASGLTLPPTPAAAQRKMREIVPFCAPGNPIDTAAPGMSDMSVTSRFMEIALADGGFSTVVAFLAHLGLSTERFDALRPGLSALRQRFPDRLIALAIIAPRERRDALMAEGFLVYEDPSQAVTSVAALARIGSAIARGPRDAPPDVAAPLPRHGGEAEAKRVLAEAGIPVVAERLATSSDEAARAAAELGLPVALKIASPDILHKTEIGGIILDVASVDDAVFGYARLIAGAVEAAPDAVIDGVLVAPMVQGGVETIIGVNRDPVFGPVVMFGIGGVFVEIYRDVAFRVAPFGRDVAHEMIREVNGFPLLDGARGAPRADIEALADALARLSAYAAANRDAIASIDINPFIVLPAGHGAIAVDALIVRATDDGKGN